MKISIKKFEWNLGVCEECTHRNAFVRLYDITKEGQKRQRELCRDCVIRFVGWFVHQHYCDN